MRRQIHLNDIQAVIHSMEKTPPPDGNLTRECLGVVFRKKDGSVALRLFNDGSEKPKAAISHDQPNRRAKQILGRVFHEEDGSVTPRLFNDPMDIDTTVSHGPSRPISLTGLSAVELSLSEEG